MYIFNGIKPFTAEYYPEGSHPNSLIRLENIIPQIYEFFSLRELHQITNIELTRKDMVKICSSAANSVGLFWLRKNNIEVKVKDNYFLMGSIQRKGMDNYLKIIIETWDEIEPTIKKFRRFGAGSGGLLHFSKEARERRKSME